MLCVVTALSDVFVHQCYLGLWARSRWGGKAAPLHHGATWSSMAESGDVEESESDTQDTQEVVNKPHFFKRNLTHILHSSIIRHVHTETPEHGEHFSDEARALCSLRYAHMESLLLLHTWSLCWCCR